MALPVITFNDLTGSDTEASGAGPETAVFGTKGRVSATTPVRMGFFETSAPDLSGVLADGSHAVWFDQATGGFRDWFKITSVKDTVQDVTCDITTGTPNVTDTVTTGMSVGDVIRITGAGAAGADLYADITVVVSSTALTIDTNAGTTVADGALKNPKQVGANVNPSATASDRAWAIGGKRLSLNSSTQLWADLQAGWKVAFEWNDGGSYTATAAMTCNISGNTTDGRIEIYGTLGPDGQKPIIQSTLTTTDLFLINAGLYRIYNLQFEICDEAIRIASTGTVTVHSCDFNKDGLNNVVQPITVTATGFYGAHIYNCFFNQTNGTSISLTGSVGARVQIDSCHFSPRASPSGIVMGSNWMLLGITNCVFDGMVTGIALGSSSTNAQHVIENNTFVDCATCISSGNVAQLQGLVCRNNVFSQGSTGLSFSAGADHAISVCDYNVFYTMTTPRVNVSAGANDITGGAGTAADPQYWDTDSGSVLDLRVGQNMKAKGYPRQLPNSLMTTAVDIGAAQRLEPVGGDIDGRIIAAEDTGDFWALGIRFVGDGPDGTGITLHVPKAEIPAANTAHVAAIIGSVQAFLRTQAGSTLVQNMSSA